MLKIMSDDCNKPRPAGFSDSDDSDFGEFSYSCPVMEEPEASPYSPLPDGDESLSSKEEEFGGVDYKSSNRNVPRRNYSFEKESWEPMVSKPVKVTDEMTRLACHSGHLDTIKAYFDENMDKIDGIFSNKMTALMTAAKSGQVEVVKYILEKGAKPEVKNEERLTALMAAVISDKDFLTVRSIMEQLLSNSNVNIDAKDAFGRTALILSVKRKNRSVAEFLLQNGADIEAEDFEGKTCLFFATYNKDGRMVRMLLEKGANPEHVALDGTTSLEVARDVDVMGIFDLLCLVQKTKWRPGLDPSLMNDIDVDKVHKKDRILSILEDTESGQIASALCQVGLDRCIDNFSSHQISFAQFLQMDDESLQKIGIKELGTREKILGVIQKLQDLPFLNSSLPRLPSAKQVTMYDAVCIFHNMSEHLRYMKILLQSFKNKIISNPSGLQEGLEQNDITDLLHFCKELKKGSTNLTPEVQDVTRVIKSLQNKFEYRRGDEIRKPIKRNRKALKSVAKCAGTFLILAASYFCFQKLAFQSSAVLGTQKIL